MQLFNFSRLVNKYKSEFKSITLLSGYYNDSGDLVSDETQEVTLQGAIIKHRDSKIYKSNGTLTEQDRALFLLEPLSDNFLKSQIVYENNVYSVQDCNENAKFTGVYKYTLKYVSAFRKGGEKVD